MQKCSISTFWKRPHQGPLYLCMSMVRVSTKHQINFFIRLKGLRIRFQGGCILCKNAKFQNFGSFFYLPEFGPRIFQVAKQNLKIWLYIVVGFVERFPKWNVITSWHKNSQRRQDPRKWTLGRPGTWCWAPWGQITNPRQLLLCTDCNFFPRFNLPIKIYPINPHKQTHILHRICRWGQAFCTNGNLYLFT